MSEQAADTTRLASDCSSDDTNGSLPGTQELAKGDEAGDTQAVTHQMSASKTSESYSSGDEVALQGASQSRETGESARATKNSASPEEISDLGANKNININMDGAVDPEKSDLAEAGSVRPEFEAESALRRAESRREATDEELPHNTKSTKQSEAADSVTFREGQLETVPEKVSADDLQAEDIEMIVRFMKWSREDVIEGLSVCDGSVDKFFELGKERVRTTMLERSAPKQGAQATSSLLKEALAVYRKKKPKSLQRESGDVFVILDRNDLSRSCRLHSEDAAKASISLKSELERLCVLQKHPQGVIGIKYLFVLKANNPDQMPLLCNIDLDAARTDHENSIYTQQRESTEADIKVEKGENEVKVESPADGGEPTPNQPEIKKRGVDWVAGYESFLHMLSNLGQPNHGISQSDIGTALQQIEAVARIANHYQAKAPGLIIERILTTNFVIEKGDELWNAIAKDAARWLVIAVQLQSSVLYIESFKHVAGCYPDWPWSISRRELEKQVPSSVTIAIVTKSEQLFRLRTDIDLKLLCHTIADKGRRAAPNGGDPTTGFVVSIFREWIAGHVEYIRSGGTSLPLSKSICSHEKGCISTAGFYRMLKGTNGDCLSLLLLQKTSSQGCTWDGKEIKKMLAILKRGAAEMVAPLVEKKLRGNDTSLAYLTCIDVLKEDIPWNMDATPS